MVRRETPKAIQTHNKVKAVAARKQIFKKSLTPLTNIQPRASSTPKTPRAQNTSKSEKSLNSSKRRAKSGAKALKEIRDLQRTTNLLIPKLPFLRLVKEIITDLTSYSSEPFRIQLEALRALHEMTEIVMSDLFTDGVLCAIHAKRVTLQVSDMRLARRLRGRQDPINL